MKNVITILSAFCLVGTLLFTASEANAQFSKPVIVFKGKVRNAKTLEPHYARVSVRELSSMTTEVTASRANAESGHYLVILKPQTEYWLYIEGPDINAKSIRIKTPATSGQTINVIEDIPVTVLGGTRSGDKAEKNG